MTIGIKIYVINESTGIIKISIGKFYNAETAKGGQK
jgi:hypothetical protein